MAMEWRQADVFKLIEGYKERKLLWDPTLDDYKNRNKRHDAWVELDEQCSVDAGESEKKMRKLISQFNRECKNILKSGRGAGNCGKWIYFKSLIFLKDKNKPRASMDAGLFDEQNKTSSDAVDDAESQVEETQHLDDGEVVSPHNISENENSPVSKEKPSTARARAPKRKINAMAEEAYMVMKGLQMNKQKRDEFDVFAENVAMTMRKLSKVSSVRAKFEINKILFSAELGEYEIPSRPFSDATSSSTYSYTSNSSCMQQTAAAIGLPLSVDVSEKKHTYHGYNNIEQSQSILGNDDTEMDSVLLDL